MTTIAIEITYIQGKLIENLSIQTQMLKLGMGVPQFIKDNQDKLEKELETLRSKEVA